MDARSTRRTFLLGASAVAASLVLPGSASAGTRSSRHEKPLGPWIDQRRMAAKATALGVAAVHKGEIVYARGFGVLDRETREPATADSVFMLASISKTVAVVALMQAWEEGKIDLDADVNDILPFDVRNPKFPEQRITARTLATHTSGIHDSWGVLTPMYVDGDSPVALGSYLESYLVPGGQHYREGSFTGYAPGKHYQYSNIGASLMAFVVEEALGVPFDEYCDEHIFQVLGMDNTSWHLEGLDEPKIAMPYRYHSDTGRYEAFGQYGYPDYPDGQLRTSARSLAKFLAAISDHGQYEGRRILKASTVAMILKDQLHGAVSWPQGLIYYRVSPHNLDAPVWGHTGGDSGVATLAFFSKKDRSGAVVLSNSHAGRPPQWDALQQVRDRLIIDASDL